jgi:TonB family protein
MKKTALIGLFGLGFAACGAGGLRPGDASREALEARRVEVTAEGLSDETPWARSRAASFVGDVRRALASWWAGRDQGGLRQELAVRLLLSREGVVLDVRLDRSSGSEALDDSVIRTIADAGPFGPLPNFRDSCTLYVSFKPRKARRGPS